MYLRKCSVLFLWLACAAWSYEIPDEEATISRTCSLGVSLEIIPDHEMKKPSGRAKVTAHLCDRDGNPYRNENIQLSATLGTFLCRLPEEAAETDESSTGCFTTGDDGVARVYLVNIPFNRQVHVKATYDCGDYIVTGSANAAVSRGVVKRKKAVRP